jgi:hypothetical protein
MRFLPGNFFKFPGRIFQDKIEEPSENPCPLFYNLYSFFLNFYNDEQRG